MTRADLLALASRVEAAQGADREIDAAVMRCFTNSVESDDGEWWYGPHDEAPRKVPAFTASLDAAASLVPDGWIVANIGQNDDKTWFAELRQGHRTSYTKVVFAPKDYKAATPALALAAAALRAMAEEAARDE